MTEAVMVEVREHSDWGTIVHGECPECRQMVSAATDSDALDTTCKCGKTWTASITLETSE